MSDLRAKPGNWNVVSQLLDDAKEPGEDDPKMIAYFGPDADDPVVRRRISQWRYAEFAVSAFAFSRERQSAHRRSDYIDLGYIEHQSRLARLLTLPLACFRIFRSRRRLRGARLLIARNLDNLCLALVARMLWASDASLVYEVLDINPSCTSPDRWGRVLRTLEKWFLSHIDLLIVSSPHFTECYYQNRLGYRGNWFLFENKVPKFANLPRPGAVLSHGRREPGERARWRIGWFGYLDDQRSWNSLKALAEALPNKVEIYIRGLPYTNFDMNGFLADVARLENVTYGGGFSNPEDLAEIYGSVDLIWSIDCNDLSANSKWLLTNSIYEAGYFGKPALAVCNTAVGDVVSAHGTGWCLDDPIEPNLVRLLGGLSAEEYAVKVAQIASTDIAMFCETNEIHEIWALVQREVGSSRVPLASNPGLPVA